MLFSGRTSASQADDVGSIPITRSIRSVARSVQEKQNERKNDADDDHRFGLLVPGLVHLIALRSVGGLEAYFSAFVRAAAERYPEWTQGWFNPDPEHTIHPFYHDAVGQALTHRLSAKHRWGLKLPSRPNSLRVWHCRRALAATGTDIVMIWNRTARTRSILDAIGAENCIHWEHGGIWHRTPGRGREQERYLKAIPLVIANSRASERVLQLLWGYAGEIRVCLNALQPSLMPERPIAKQFPSGRAIRLGVAARLHPTKGVAVALHALRLLLGQSMDVTLHIAGAGAELDRLKLLAQELGISSVTHFHGAVRDMRRFYMDIDCLLHSPLTEAFGLVAVEAAARGCPVIAAAVDGLPEAVEHGVSGQCVAPTLPLAEYLRLGGTSEGIPDYVYDPGSDTLSEPRIVDPATLTAEVCNLFSSVETYERFSRSASEHVLRRFRFDKHLDQVMDVINGFIARRN